MRLLVSVHPPDAPVGAAATAPLRFVFAVPAHAVHIGDLAHAILDRAGFDQEAAVAALSLDGFNLVPEDAVATVLTNNDKVDVHVTHIIPPPPSARKKRARAPSPDAFDVPDTVSATRSRKRARTSVAPAALSARTARARTVANPLIDSDALDAITHHLVSLIARQNVGAAAAADDDEEEDEDDQEDAAQYEDGSDDDDDDDDDDDYEDAAKEEDDEGENSDEAPDELPARAQAKAIAASRGAPIVQEEEDEDEDEEDDEDYEEGAAEVDSDEDEVEDEDDHVDPPATDSDDEAIVSAYDQLLKDLQPTPAAAANGQKDKPTKANDDEDDGEDDSDFEMASDADDSSSSSSDSEDSAVSDSDSSSSSDDEEEIARPPVPALTFEPMDSDSDSDYDSDAAFDASMSSLAVTAVDCTKFPATKCAPTDARQALAAAAKKNKTRRGARGGAGRSRKDTDSAAAAAAINFAKCAKLTPMMARKVPAGTQLAFKQMHLSEDCTPEISEYRMAKVLDQQGVEFTVQWATSITESAAKTKSRGQPLADDGQWVLNYDDENGGDARPRGLAKFVFEDGHADGTGEKATVTFAEMVEPVIVSWGSRPATPARGGVSTATPASASKVATPQAAAPLRSSR
ncbi:hypothetical protein AMAG_02764 [Allomyces macrogynus ATCC 38327]|uniref:Coilin n=1 Tax=Allomyces macrogynus (strain ATCC 38327) TaxID=578462 RepID=A0A0L0S3Q4_ALLM3|nr:hypothetical protein AMAG_02764 [Allomyces macrogynus ATCC 38327]|eukprot:KNE57004.1 hypothetical protein AMAG_02764 [Allomyces macrogynus ATCC 38327]